MLQVYISSDTKDFAYESLWALAKSYEYYKYKDYKDSNKLQQYIIDKAESWKLMFQLEPESHYFILELLKNQDFAHLQNNDLKNEKITEIDETSYLSTLPKEPECNTSTQELDSIAMSLSEEEIKALGVSDNDDTGV
ncbi:hypothetical protein [Candidatus Tisiphia endosymbiont of Hybos culiciformis]|uniref:hypothetical protein n=1 Tax=Candidatus Tisiphia endosymbiont of Hybos culiciformis TaxID=3139331 RepID=UPI003CCAAB62